MNRKAIILITVIGWVIGQFLMLSAHIMAGITVIAIATLFGVLFYFRVWEVFKKPGTAGVDMTVAPAVMVSAALFTAIAAVIVVKAAPQFGLMLFIFAGFLLFVSKPKNEKLFDFFELPKNTSPLEKWEPWFMLILIIVSAVIRLYDLGNIPPVGNGGEGLGYADLQSLSGDKNYTPQVGGGLDWPSLTYYMSLIFTNILGWDIANARVLSGLLGVISLVAFYFLARRLTSPVTAAVTVVMYSVFIMHITTSRLFGPPLTLLFCPHIIALALLLAANKNPKWYLFFASGLALGFSLHGYVPGRGLFLLFVAWFIVMFITRKKIFFKTSNFVVFWAGFVVIASPTLFFAIFHSDSYWAYVNSVNPSKSAGLAGYINLIMSRLPQYAGMYNVKTAWDVVSHMPYKPLLTPIAGLLFPLGLFLCAFSFWKPVPSILLILYCGGMVPSLLGGGCPIQPFAQRTLLTFPIIFLIAAYALERLKRVYFSYDSRTMRAIFITAAVTASIWTFQDGLTEYFVRFTNNPAVKVNVSYIYYNMKQVYKKHPKADIYLTPFFTNSDSLILFTPYGKPLTGVPAHIDSMLALNPGKESIVFLGPFYANAVELFKRYFPNSESNIERETKERMKDPFYSTLPINPSARMHTDPYVPFVYNASVYLPEKDVRDFQTMLVPVPGGVKDRIRVFGGTDFAEKYEGKTLKLRGAILAADTSFYVNPPTPLIINCVWKGWKIVIDGKQQVFGRPLAADGGIHFFELSGRVPGGQKGDLPLSVMLDKDDLVAKGRVVAVGEPFGARIFDTPGENSWDKPYTYSHRFITQNYRMYDGLSMALTFSRVEKAMLRVPVSGEYEMKQIPDNRFMIKMDNKVVYDNLIHRENKGPWKMTLSKDRPVKVEIHMICEGVPSFNRASAIYFKGPGMDNFEMAPVFWFYPED